MNKAYALLNVKAVDERPDEWVIEGVASTPVADRMGDIVEPLGAKFKLPMPLLWQHDHQAPVGRVEFAKPTKTGIPYRAHLPKVMEPGRLKDRVDEAIQSIKHRLVGAVSIGFSPVADAMERMKDGWRFKEWEWLELSLVTIPANPEATITGLKSFDDHVRAVIGNRAPGFASPAAVGTPSATKAVSTRSQKGTTMKTIQEQLAELQETRAHKQSRAKELTDIASAESRDLNDDEGSEVDQLVTDIKALDNQIRVKSVEAMSAASARAVDTSNYGKGAARGPTIIVRKGDKFDTDEYKGLQFARRVIAKAVGRIQDRSPVAVAEERWGKTDPRLVAIIKADVAGGGTGSGEWGAELADADTKYTGDFIEFLHGMTVFDRLPLRTVPSRVHIKGQDGAATGYWVGESKAIPATAMDFSDVELSPLKVGAVAVVSNELLKDSTPSAEMLIRDALAEASAQRVDTTFLSTTAASAGVSPAGILNGLTANTSGGATADDVREDLAGLLLHFSNLKYSMNGLVLVTTPTVAMQLYMLRNALGQREFSEVSMGGGNLDGIPVYTGHNVGTGDLIMMSPRDIYKIGDSGIEVSISREATIEQDNAPTGATDTPVAMSTKFTNMFQAESTAIKVVRHINFAKRRTSAVAYIGNAAYGAITSV